SREEWLVARMELLAQEKELTRRRDALKANLRRLPMVRIDKEYVFEGPDGEATLLDLFEERRQLIIGHFMFDPSWDDGCPSCTAGADQPRAPRPRAHPRHHVRLRVPGTHRQDPELQGAHGLDVPLVLVVRQRLQLRLPRHARRRRFAR